jgi:hypothetical protein
MESSAWTNERLDEFSRRIDQGFAHVDQRFVQVDQRFEQADQRFVRIEARMDQGFARVDRDLRDLRGEMQRGFQAINGLLFRIGGAIIVALIGVIAAILASGG